VLYSAPEAKLPIPAAADILKTLNRAHPRLLASQSDFDRLQQDIKTNALMGRWYGSVQNEAEKLLQEPASRYEIPDGKRLLATSRRVLGRVYTLGFSYQMTKDRRFSDRAWKELDAAGHFKDWNPSHFLDTAEMTHAFAIGYDWLYDAWTPEQRAFLRDNIVTKGLNLGIEIERKKSWWAAVDHNWNQVCNGGLGMGALAVANEEPALAGEFLSAALKSIQIPMPGFAPDGGWMEGPGYWAYATAYNVVFLAALDSALGTDFNLSSIQGFSEAGTFPIYLNGPSGQSFDFADCGSGSIHGPQLFWMAKKFNRPEFAALEESLVEGPRSELGAKDLIWFKTSGGTNTLRALPLDKYYRNIEVATMRSEWNNPQALFVGVKAGRNGVNHGHLDLGSFVFDATGKRWALDLGSDNYNMPDYFGKLRWTYYRLRAEGHNTLVLNPDATPDQNVKADSKIVRFQSKPERSFAVTDLTPAYSRNAQKVWRGIALVNRKELLIQDEVRSEKPADLWWFMHTSAQIKLNGASAVLKSGDQYLTARILSPAGAVFTQMAAAPLPNSPNPKEQNANKGITKLTVHLPDVKDLRLTILLTPGTGNARPGAIVPLEKW